MNGWSNRVQFGSASVVKVIVILNVVAFLAVYIYVITATGTMGLGNSESASMEAMARAEYNVYQLFGLMPYGYGFLPWQPLTSLFLHGGIWHLLFNMLALWFIGGALERHLGSRKFMFYYFFSGIVAALFAALFSTLSIVMGMSNMAIPTIGASGAIFAVLIGLAYFFPNSVVYLNFIIPVRIKWLVAFLIGLNFIFLFQGTNVSVSSHLMGALIGFIYLVIRYPMYPKLEKVGYPLRKFTDRTISPVWDKVVSLFYQDKEKTISSERSKFKVFTRDEVQDSPSKKETKKKKEGKMTSEELLDILLEKISRRGIDSLTPSEREFLDKFSRDQDGHNRSN